MLHEKDLLFVVNLRCVATTADALMGPGMAETSMTPDKVRFRRWEVEGVEGLMSPQ
jgi:hypothetical protein